MQYIWPFNSPGHSLDDLRIVVLEVKKSCDESLRRRRESYWIKQLRSLHPEGMNLTRSKHDIITPSISPTLTPPNANSTGRLPPAASVLSHRRDVYHWHEDVCLRFCDLVCMHTPRTHLIKIERSKRHVRPIPCRVIPAFDNIMKF